MRVAGSNPVVRSNPRSEAINPLAGGGGGAGHAIPTLTLQCQKERRTMANPARRATPTHPLIGDLIQAHRQQWSDAYQQNALSYLNRYHAWLEARRVSSSTPPPPT